MSIVNIDDVVQIFVEYECFVIGIGVIVQIFLILFFVDLEMWCLVWDVDELFVYVYVCVYWDDVLIECYVVWVEFLLVEEFWCVLWIVKLMKLFGVYVDCFVLWCVFCDVIGDCCEFDEQYSMLVFLVLVVVEFEGVVYWFVWVDGVMIIEEFNVVCVEVCFVCVVILFFKQWMDVCCDEFSGDVWMILVVYEQVLVILKCWELQDYWFFENWVMCCKVVCKKGGC